MAAMTPTRIEDFLLKVRPSLMKAFLGSVGPERADDALSHAFAWAFENWDRLSGMDNPVGYLFRVGTTRSTPRKAPPALPAPPDVGLPDFEPGLIPALLTLTTNQRTAVWLIHACGWTYPDAAEAMGIGESTVCTHATRGLAALRTELRTNS